jgi:hypothetical protein
MRVNGSVSRRHLAEVMVDQRDAAVVSGIAVDEIIAD